MWSFWGSKLKFFFSRSLDGGSSLCFSYFGFVEMWQCTSRSTTSILEGCRNGSFVWLALIMSCAAPHVKRRQQQTDWNWLDVPMTFTLWRGVRWFWRMVSFLGATRSAVCGSFGSGQFLATSISGAISSHIWSWWWHFVVATMSTGCGSIAAPGASHCVRCFEEASNFGFSKLPASNSSLQTAFMASVKKNALMCWWKISFFPKCVFRCLFMHKTRIQNYTNIFIYIQSMAS